MVDTDLSAIDRDLPGIDPDRTRFSNSFEKMDSLTGR
jgi:hypothetical protein